jgi:uncharacterized protein (DUF433 family)
MTHSDLMGRDRDMLGGTLVFAHTRVPVQTLFDYLEGGHSLQEFLGDFPTVRQDPAIAVLEECQRLLLVCPGRW